MSVCWCSRGVFFSENYVFGNGKICKIQQTKHFFVLLPSKDGTVWAISHVAMPTQVPFLKSSWKYSL